MCLLSLQNREEDIYGSVNPFTVPASQEDEIYSQLKTWGVQAIALKDIEYVSSLASHVHQFDPLPVP